MDVGAKRNAKTQRDRPSQLVMLIQVQGKLD
jgi:hypothetical protein